MRGGGEVTRAVVRFNNSPLSAAFKWGSSLERLPGAPCVSLIYKHIMEAERGEKTRSKICTLVRPWVSPALMYKATTKAPVDVCVCECVRHEKQFFFSFFKIISTQVHDSNIHLPPKRGDTWCFKIHGSSLCSKRLPGASERQFNDERQHVWMQVFAFRSQGKNRKKPKQFWVFNFLLKDATFISKDSNRVEEPHLTQGRCRYSNRLIPPRINIFGVLSCGSKTYEKYEISKYLCLSVAGNLPEVRKCGLFQSSCILLLMLVGILY